jgi:hypothetical protein
MTTRLEGAKIRAVNQRVERAEFGFDMAALLNSIDDKLNAISATLNVEPLGIPTVPRNITASNSSVPVTLTPACRRVSIIATGAPARYLLSITGSVVPATSTSHLIQTNERIDIKVPLNTVISFIRSGASDSQISISELTT